MNIRELKGIGEKTEKLFNKLGIYTTEELISYYPRNYDIYTQPVNIKDLDNVTGIPAIYATISSAVSLKSFKRISVVSAMAKDSDGSQIKLTWFNMPYLRNTLKKGCSFIFRGQIKKDSSTNSIVMEQPAIYTPADYELKTGTLQPVYSLTKGLTNNMVTKCIKLALKDMELKDYLPEKIRNYADLQSYEDSVKEIHFPLNRDKVIKARKRLIFDEFFLFLMALRQFRTQTDTISNSYIINNYSEGDRLIESLPYKLTNSQIAAIKELRQDMSGNKVMNRLIQGDVGCGKTIIAFVSLMDVTSMGYQGALMVPTEVLAKQHYENLMELKEKYGLNINPVLLTGSMKASEKKEVYKQISEGMADIIIGTHALIQENVIYKNLALVITDEQHRFGVKQREKLSEKGCLPHILVMSATPIPRTLAIILYGDLDISVIKELPSDRLPIKNCVVGHDYRKKAYKFIENQVKAGHQAYVICPMVDANEQCESVSCLCDVVSYTEILRKEMDEDINIAYLHGKMTAKEKNSIMEQFLSNKIQVLVSTTVIEVGVNVPNATVMMIEDAERFGLACLHQLRGRVGRGRHQSYCIFVTSKNDEKTMNRLNILNKSNDGFFIASEDLKLRGPGDFFGIRQSGEMNFKLGDVFADSETLKLSSDVFKAIEGGEILLTEEEQNSLKGHLQKYMDMYCTINL